MAILKKKLLVIAAICTMLFAACSSPMPASFWTRFEPDKIVTKKSDQGPWGGTRAILWKADEPGYFSTADILSFAAAKGWVFKDSTAYTARQVHSWTYGRELIFPLSFREFQSDTSISDGTYKDFPRTIDTDAIIYTFITSWMKVQPGTDEEVPADGYVMLSADKTQMAVYHLWGD